MKAIVNGRLIVPDARGDFQVVEHQALLYGKRIKTNLSNYYIILKILSF